MWSKAPEQLLDGPWGGIILSSACSSQQLCSCATCSCCRAGFADFSLICSFVDEVLNEVSSFLEPTPEDQVSELFPFYCQNIFFSQTTELNSVEKKKPVHHETLIQIDSDGVPGSLSWQLIHPQLDQFHLRFLCCAKSNHLKKALRRQFDIVSHRVTMEI